MSTEHCCQNADCSKRLASVDRRWMLVRVAIALVLWVAAVLKAHQLVTVSSLGEGLLYARWFNILVVEFELFFGVWLNLECYQS
jgi:hypothetical protein